MKAVLGRKDIEKIISRHLPHLTPVSWDGGDLTVIVDMDELRKEEIRGQEVWLTRRDTKVKPGKYSVCSTIKRSEGNPEVFYIVVQ